MLSLTRLNALGQNKNGQAIVDYAMTEKMTGYYLGGKEDQAMMRWFGQGAEALGLTDKEVTKEDMTSLGEGFSPEGKPLCQNAGEKPKEVLKVGRDGEERTVLEGGHRFGFDLTTSANKYLSTAFALADPEERLRILNVHRDANTMMLKLAESLIETRRGQGGKEVIALQGLVVSSHDHLTNRNLDPNMHSHNLIYGVAQGEDGSWGTFDPKELYRARHALDAVYQAECAKGMERLGYAIRQEEVLQKGESVRSWAIEGIPDELVKAYSTRRDEILEYQQEFQVDAQTATMATRKEKDEPGLDVLTTEWRTRAKEIAPDLVRDLHSIKGLHESSSLQPTSTEELMEKLHKTEAIATDYDILKLIATEHVGVLSNDEIQEKVKEFKSLLVPVEAKALHEHDRSKHAPDKVAREYRETRYQAPFMAEIEQGIVHLAKQRESEDNLRLSPDSVSDVIKQYEQEKGFTLSSEQQHAIRHLTTGSAGVGIMEGYAGTGKTTVAEVYKRAFEAEGFTLHGCAISNAAAKKLQDESGMESRSVAKTIKMIKDGELKLDAKTVLVLDEAGMIGSKHTLSLMHYCKEAGSKFILQGDENQIQPVDAGSGFTLAKGEIGSAKLKDIRRQASAEARHTAELFYDDFHDGLTPGAVKSRQQSRDKGEAIVGGLASNNALEAYNTQDEAMQGLVKAYLSNQAEPDDKLIITHTHNDKNQVNTLLREGLKAQGALSKTDHLIRCYENKEFVERNMSEGDRVRFLAKDKDLGVINGTEGILTKIEPWREGGHTLTVKTDQAELMFNTHEYCALDLNYALTAHKAQGQGKAYVYHLLNSGMMDNQSSLVAFTRLTKGDYKLYGTADDMDHLKERLGMDRKKENALAVPQVIETPKQKQHEWSR